jgi:hypothetical protein
MGQKCSTAKLGGHFLGSALCWGMRLFPKLRGRPSGRLSGRPSGRLSGRLRAGPKAGYCPAQCRLRARRFADISTARSIQHDNAAPAILLYPSIFSASLALDACAIASALAQQRFSTATAAATAVAPAPVGRPVEDRDGQG